MRHANVAIFVPHSGCPNLCSFCNQRSISGAMEVPDAARVHEICQSALGKIRDGADAEIAFFGGSFTAIERPLMLSLLRAAHEYVGANGFSGIRISTRPDCIDDGVLDILAAYGVRAIELGAQSMDDRVLKMNLRGHTAADTVRAARLIKERGFELGLQMMTGLHGDTAQGAVDTARALAALSPDTARVYPTMVIKDTLLHELYLKGEYVPMTLEETVDCCCRVLDIFDEAGVRVIRLGLHSTESLGADIAAGAYHPAFGELCYSRRFLSAALKRTENLPKGDIDIYVSPSCISKMTGQRGSNIKALRELGYNARIYADASLTPDGISVRAASRNTGSEETNEA